MASMEAGVRGAGAARGGRVAAARCDAARYEPRGNLYRRGARKAGSVRAGIAPNAMGVGCVGFRTCIGGHQTNAKARGRTRRDQVGVAMNAAGQGAAAGDPYEVLGVAPGSDTEAVSRAYKARLASATSDEDKQVIEAAHTSILMSSLTARMKGGSGSITKDIRYADRPPMFRWRPRVHICEQKDVLINGAIWAFAIYWANKSTYSPWQPLMLAFLVFFVRMNYKLMPLMPRPSTDDRTEIRAADTKRLGRAFGVVGGLFGMMTVIVASLPSMLMSLGLPVPLWLMGSLYEYSVGVAGLLGAMVGASFLK